MGPRDWIAAVNVVQSNALSTLILQARRNSGHRRGSHCAGKGHRFNVSLQEGLMQPVEPDLKLDGFSLWVLGRQFPGANDHWDGNWLNVRARVEAPGALVEAQ